MKDQAIQAKSNHGNETAAKAPAAGPQGASAPPPGYGIDFLDRPREPNRTGLPDRLKVGIETLSGLAMDDVRVHYNSEKPAQLQAVAYTQGTDIYVGPGQERHLPHEAWHVVQQKEGRVRATTQLKGQSLNDDAQLEYEANVMGEQSLRAASASARHGVAQRATEPVPVVQRDVGFEFETNWIVQKRKHKTNPILDKLDFWPSYEDLGRREIFYQDSAGGFEAMADDHSNIEFRTNHFPETIAGIANLTTAMTALTNLANQLNGKQGGQFKWTAPLPATMMEVRVKPHPKGSAMIAAPQATVGVRQDQVFNMLHEVSTTNAAKQDLMGTGDAEIVRGAVTKANSAGNVAGAAPSREFKGLLALLISYIYKGFRPYQPGSQNHLSYSKLIAPIMARTDFVRMFDETPEAVYFRAGGAGGPAAFSAYVIATINAPSISANAPLFRYGYGDGLGGVEMLSLTRDAWLQGIASGTDNLSGLVNHHISDSLGSRGHGANSTDPDAGGNVGVPGMILELRRMKDLPIAQWQPVAIRVANFIRTLNNNTANPGNPVNY